MEQGRAIDDNQVTKELVPPGILDGFSVRVGRFFE
jgi:hypothetical protein